MERQSQSAEGISVLIADDHPVVRHGLVALLGTLPGITVVGQAGSGREAVSQAALRAPDVVIMDLGMPDLSGVEATKQILRSSPLVRILVLTMYDDDELVAEAMRAGARGYLVKGAEQGDIDRAVRAVAAGEVIFSGSVAGPVLNRLGRPEPPAFLAQMTVREREILDLIATGIGNTSISEQLHLAPKTVSNHISSIFLKLGVASRSQAIVLAREAGLGRRD